MLESLNVGWDAKYPSSMKQFFQWYATIADYPPIDEEFALWAIFDIIEAATYRAAMIPEFVKNGYLPARHVMQMLTGEGDICLYVCMSVCSYDLLFSFANI